MKPLKLRLYRFKGVKAGLGIDDITIDIDRALGDYQLIALRGRNGQGKSTLIESMQPYRLMASRASGNSPRSFSYFGEVYPEKRDPAIKELHWEHNGKRYRSLISIAEKSQRAFLYDADDNPVEINGTLSDGNTGSYDALVEEIMGPPELFFLAAFSAQSKAPVSSYKASEIKSLIADMLCIGHYGQMHDKCKAVIRGLEGRLSGFQEGVTRHDTLAASISAARDEAREHARSVHTLSLTLEQAIEKARALSRQRDELRAEGENQRDLMAERDRLLQRKEDLLSRARERTEAEQRRYRQETESIDKAIAANASALSTAEATVRQIGADLAARHKQLEDRPRLKESADRLPAMAEAGKRLAEKLEQARTFDELVARVKTENAEIERKAAALSARLDRAEDAVQRAEADASLIDDVPCAGMDINGQCQLLGAARESATKAEALRAEAAGIRAEMAELPGPAEIPERILPPTAELTEALQKARDEYAVAKQDKALLDTLEQVMLDVAELEKRKAEATERRDVLSAEAQDLARQNQAITPARDYLVEAKGEADDMDRQIEALGITEDLATRMNAVEATITETEALCESLRNQVAEARSAEAAATARAKALSGEAEQYAKAAVDARTLSDEIANWRLLSKALSPNGIIALAIDDAGPDVSALANEILLECCGPRFSVAIETQRRTQDGGLAEDFDIRVIDADSGESKSFRSMSGGERVWINESIVRALALYHAQNSGNSFRCLFSDESDGALDPERKMQYLQMKRKVLRLGGYDHEIFISHSPALWDLADVVYDVEDLVQ